MEVILLERIEKLGQMGDVVSVKSGFARNYLLPQNKALRNTKQNLEHFESQKAQLEADNLTRKAEAEKIAEKLQGLNVTIIRAAGETGQLYGSVTGRDIAKAVSESGFKVDKNQIVLDRALKALGLESIRIILHPEISVRITANIARNIEEASQQSILGHAINTVAEDKEAENQTENVSIQNDEDSQEPIPGPESPAEG
ncbi:MAG: 50S ribosomal protein L9 [Rhodospirillaceae bacterium]|nr:50S ribosomal protein L9 [Rhodospirillaceae bacterium]